MTEELVPTHQVRAWLVYEINTLYRPGGDFPRPYKAQIEFHPLEFLKLSRDNFYTYYRQLIQNIFCSLTPAQKAYIKRTTDLRAFIPGLKIRAGEKKDFDLPAWGRSRQAIERWDSDLSTYQDLGPQVLRLFNREDAGNKGIFEKWKMDFLRRCIRWEDVGQFAAEGGERGVDLEAGRVWGWPAEERWYNLALREKKRTCK